MTRRSEELIALAARVTAAQRELVQISRQLDQHNLRSISLTTIPLTEALTTIQTAIGQEATK